jgi:Phosphotransferase enzyme family
MANVIGSLQVSVNIKRYLQDLQGNKVMTSHLQSQIIVRKPSDLTINWAQNILKSHSNRKLNDINISKIDLISVDVGTTTRVRLAVEHDGSHALPKRWFVKMPSLSNRAKLITALPRLLPTEIRFYNEIADFVPVNKPTVLSAYSRLGLGSTLVLNDVSESGAIPGRVGDTLSVEQAGLVIEQLAYLHAHFMNKATNDPDFRWLAGPVRRLEDGLGTALAVPLMKRGLRLASDWVSSRLHIPAFRYARSRKQIMHFLSKDTATLIHHDCHPGNLFWHNGKPGFLDWQMVRLGEEISDVSYFLATALAPQTRRLNEIALLTKYHEIMLANNPTTTDFKDLLNRYRAHLVYPFEAMIVTLAVGGMMQLESNLEMIYRAALAIEDHDTFGILPNTA